MGQFWGLQRGLQRMTGRVSNSAAGEDVSFFTEVTRIVTRGRKSPSGNENGNAFQKS